MWDLGFVRELKIFMHNSNLWLLSFLFYLIIVLCAPIALSYSVVNLRDLAPVIMWLTFILANMQLSSQIFVLDYQNGWYQQIFIKSEAPSLYFFYKMLATTLVFSLPVFCLTPLLALSYGLQWSQTIVVCSSMLLAAPAICFISAIFAALTVGSHQRAGLLSVLVLPLCLPIYILGVASAHLCLVGASPYPAMALLAAISIFAMLLAPKLISLSIRNSFEY